MKKENLKEYANQYTEVRKMIEELQKLKERMEKEAPAK